MKVRWWPFDASSRIASTRIRCMRVIEGLRPLGVDAGLYAPGEPPPELLVLSKRYDPETMAHARALQAQGTRVVLDLCDNLFFAEDPNPASLRRAELLRGAAAAVDAVTASTEVLAQVVRDEVPDVAAVYVVGDAFETAFDPSDWNRQRVAAEASLVKLRWQLLRTSAGAPTRLLWFGQHGSAHASGGMLDLMSVMGPLNEVALEHPVTLTVISNNEQKFRKLRSHARFPLLYSPWDIHSFSRAARLHHIALLPVQQNPFTVCKTNNRLATSLLHGLAVIADPIPSYEEFADAICLGDWRRSLARLCEQPQARRLAVERGRQRLQAQWTIGSISRIWLETLQRVRGTGLRVHSPAQE